MPNRNNLPETSLEAYHSVSPEMLTNHHKNILIALNKLKSGNYEQIADAVSMERHQIGRRLSEMERMGIIYKPGEKRVTSTGRNAFVYKLVENGEKSVEMEKALPGLSVGELAKPLIQKSLF